MNEGSSPDLKIIVSIAHMKWRGRARTAGAFRAVGAFRGALVAEAFAAA